MLRTVGRWLTWVVVLAGAAGCVHTPPTPLPTMTPAVVEAPACGHPYFALLPQTYWRYAITTRQGDGEPTPREPLELRVGIAEGDAGQTVATLTYSSGGDTTTYQVECPPPFGLVGWDHEYPPPPPFVHFYRYLPPADRLAPGYSWDGLHGSIHGSSGGTAYSTTCTVLASETVVFQGRQYEGLKIRQVESLGLTPGGGVSFFNEITAEATKVYTIELARGLGIVRQVAVGEASCTSDAPTPQEHERACDLINLTVDYELLEYGTR